VETYTDYKKWVDEFIEFGCADDPVKLDESPECETLFTYASGIVNRGCPDPGDGGCPGCM